LLEFVFEEYNSHNLFELDINFELERQVELEEPQQLGEPWKLEGLELGELLGELEKRKFEWLGWFGEQWVEAVRKEYAKEGLR